MAIGEGPVEEGAGVFVAVIAAEVEGHQGLAGLGRVQHPGAAPAALPLRFADHGQVTGLAPLHAAEAAFQADQLLRRFLEGGGLGQHLVPELNLALGIAAVQGLDPGQGGGLGGPPLQPAGAGAHALHGQALGQGQVGGGVDSGSGAVPHLFPDREVGGGHHVREGRQEAGHQHQLAIWGGLDTGVEARLAQGLEAPGGEVHAEQLALGQEGEAGFIIGVLEQVLVGGCRGGLALGLLDAGSHGGLGGPGLGTLVGGHGLAEQRAVRQPVQGAAQHSVQLEVRDLAQLGRGRIAHPQLCGRGSDAGEDEALAVRGPAGLAQAHASGQDHGLGAAALHGLDGEVLEAGGAVRPPGEGVDAVPCQAGHGLGQVPDGGMAVGLRQEEAVPGGAGHEDGCASGVQHLLDGLGRLLVGRGLGQQGKTQEGAQQEGRGSQHGDSGQCPP